MINYAHWVTCKFVDHRNVCQQTKYSGTPFERPPWREATPSEKATQQCKSKHKCMDFYPWWEATPLERPLFWCKRGGLTRGVPLYMHHSAPQCFDQGYQIINALNFTISNIFPQVETFSWYKFFIHSKWKMIHLYC